MQKTSYAASYESGELEHRIVRLNKILEACTLCPRQCRINRSQAEVGYCNAGSVLTVSSYFPHFGEERPLVGRSGSGTIFSTHCNLQCNFCQNYDISHLGSGEKVSTEQLAQMMLYLQLQGCHNINFVTPTHYTPQIVAALPYAIKMGLELPIVYNCGGYESLEVIELLEGIVDIYMPDAKFSSSEYAKQYANAPDYFDVLKTVLKEMHRQVGELKIENGIAYRGLLIRHLVMPNNVAGSEQILKFIAEELSTRSYVNIMSQYRPCFDAVDEPLINRRITSKEYYETIDLAKKFGLHRGF
ncbi:MAG: radical SAM protein [bacterium]|nr:MAG: radical SAM protein [bacterium]